MPLTVDEIVDVRADVESGRPKLLERVLFISGITSLTQQSALEEVLSDPGIPAAGSEITFLGSKLYLKGQSAKIGDSNELAKVSLRYEGGGNTTSTTSEVLRKGGRCSVREVETEIDREGNQISVTFNNVTQYGKITVPLPITEPYIETVETTNDPEGLALEWVGRVNSSSWKGRDAGYWMVSSAEWEEFDTTSTDNRWRFRWAFSQKDDKWLPRIGFKDKTTGDPMAGISIGNGIKEIPYHYQRDFNTKF